MGLKERMDNIKSWIDDRKERGEVTKCCFYLSPPSINYDCHITELPVVKRLTDLLERNGIVKYTENVPHWSFCDTVGGDWNLNRDWIEFGPVECIVEYCGVYPISWNLEDVVYLADMINNGELICKVYWIDPETGNYIENH